DRRGDRRGGLRRGLRRRPGQDHRPRRADPGGARVRHERGREPRGREADAREHRRRRLQASARRAPPRHGTGRGGPGAQERRRRQARLASGVQPDGERRAGTIGAALAYGERRLAEAGVDSPHVDAARLLGHVLGLARTELLVRRGEALTPSQAAAFDALLARRSAREPLQTVLGEAAFLDLTLAVTPGVLVPRPETERLVELVLAELAARPPAAGDVLIDVGTGTGSIALALKAAYPEAGVWATYVSEAARAQ